jgi:hypothetical protein
MKSNSSIHHRRRFSRSIFLYLAFFILFIAACILPGSVQPTPIVITATPPPSTDTPISPATARPTNTIIATPVPACTVLQDLNLRSGPGTAYNPPLDILKAGVDFTPIGFDPQGVPGGPWVQARIPGTNQVGWVSAGEQFVSCNLELATLPEVDVPPPPKAAPPKIGTGAVDGDNISSFRFSIDYNPEYFVRLYVFRSDDPNEEFAFNKDGRGITSVEFTIEDSDQNTIFYKSKENSSGYCIFSSGVSDCNPWPYENGQYKWSLGGEPVEEGNYKLTITVTAGDGQVGFWFIDINVDLQ